MKKPPSGDEGVSQSSRILHHLQQGCSITPLEALRLFDCWALSQRITDLRRNGHRIVTTIINDEQRRKRYAQYHLEQTNIEGST